jgi:hypothetical protein
LYKYEGGTWCLVRMLSYRGPDILRIPHLGNALQTTKDAQEGYIAYCGLPRECYSQL